MKYIDAFCHFFPEGIWNKMLNSDGMGKDIGSRMQGVPCLYDLDERFRCMDLFKDKNYTQVTSLGMPPLEAMGPPEVSIEFAKVANDGQQELCVKYPDRFVGYLASLPMNDPDAAAKEAERALTTGGACGLQIHTNINGEPLDETKFHPIYEVAQKLDYPIFLHPSRGADMTDYKSESKSKYEIWWTFGWPYETSTAMARLVFGGVMDKYPQLKFLAHHLGAMVPYFEGRVGPGWDQLGNRTTDEDYKTLLKNMKKRPLEYFKDFYADTAVFGSMSATKCGFDFYGVDKILFASDCPFDPEKGPGFIRETIKIMEQLDYSQADMEKVCFKNAEAMFKLQG